MADLKNNRIHFIGIWTIIVLIFSSIKTNAGIKLEKDTVPDTLIIPNIKKNYIHFPVKLSNPKTWIQVKSADSVLQEIEIALATSGDIDFHSRFDVSDYRGKEMQLIAEKVPVGSNWKEKLIYSNRLAVDKGIYKEALRPQIHFSPQRGWLNDPNGLFYYKGKYHMFFQHVPFNTSWDNTTMSWGHATSKDLIFWNEHKVALQPDKNGVAFSGSAVVDWYNTSGFQKHPSWNSDGKLKNPAIVLIYTTVGGKHKANYGQSLAYSLDDGLSWEKYTGSPVLPYQKTGGGDRDPKVFWYGSDRQNGKWIMPLYIKDNSFAIFSSKDLLHWEKMSEIENLGCNECPDLIEFEVENQPNAKKWVFWGGAGCYMVGDFDGIRFIPETASLTVNYSGADYAGQTFSNIPEDDGRVVQMSWLRGGYPGMPFSQAMTIPRELKLKRTPEGPRLTSYPVKEVNKLRRKRIYRYDDNLDRKAIPHMVSLEKGNAVDIDLRLSLRQKNVKSNQEDKLISIEIMGQQLTYDLNSSILKIGALQAFVPRNEFLKLRLIVDRTSVELFANDGEVALSHSFVPDLNKNPSLEINDTGRALIQQMAIHTMQAIW